MAKQKLMVDVGAILRNIDKSGEYELPEVTNYLKRYRDFSGENKTNLQLSVPFRKLKSNIPYDDNFLAFFNS